MGWVDGLMAREGGCKPEPSRKENGMFVGFSVVETGAAVLLRYQEMSEVLQRAV